MIHNEMTQHNTDIALSSNVIFSIKSEKEFLEWFNTDYGYTPEQNEIIKQKIAKQLISDCVYYEKYEFIKHLTKYL